MPTEPLQQTLWCALVGTARAYYAAAPGTDTAPTAAVVRRGLLAAAWPPGTHAGALADLVEELHAEKARLVPDCMACASPCGRTFDAAPSVLAAALAPDSEAESLKLQLMHGLQRLAALPPGEFSACGAAVYDALFAIGEAWNADWLRPKWKELQAALAQRKVGVPF